MAVTAKSARGAARELGGASVDTPKPSKTSPILGDPHELDIICTKHQFYAKLINIAHKSGKTVLSWHFEQTVFVNNDVRFLHAA